MKALKKLKEWGERNLKAVKGDHNKNSQYWLGYCQAIEDLEQKINKTSCDNTDCGSNKPPFYSVVMKQEFNGGQVVWCEDCMERDRNFVEGLYKIVGNKKKAKEWASNLAKQWNDDVITQIELKQGLREASLEYGGDHSEFDKRWQLSELSDWEDNEMLYFIITGDAREFGKCFGYY